MDFTVLILIVCVSEWRCEEEQRINSSLRGAERKAALCSLLEQEMQHIAAIGRHHINAHNNNHDKTVRNLLDKVRGHCSPSAPSSIQTCCLCQINNLNVGVRATRRRSSPTFIKMIFHYIKCQKVVVGGD